MTIESAIRAAVAQAFQQDIMPLLRPVLEQMKTTTLKKDEPDELWDTRQVAVYLKLAAITVELWRHDGRGPSFTRLGTRIRYKRSDVEEFAARNRSLIGRKGRPPQALVEAARSGLAVDGGRSRAGRERRKVVA